VMCVSCMSYSINYQVSSSRYHTVTKSRRLSVSLSHSRHSPTLDSLDSAQCCAARASRASHHSSGQRAGASACRRRLHTVTWSHTTLRSPTHAWLHGLLSRRNCRRAAAPELTPRHTNEPRAPARSSPKGRLASGYLQRIDAIDTSIRHHTTTAAQRQPNSAPLVRSITGSVGALLPLVPAPHDLPSPSPISTRAALPPRASLIRALAPAQRCPAALIPDHRRPWGCS